MLWLLQGRRKRASPSRPVARPPRGAALRFLTRGARRHVPLPPPQFWVQLCVLDFVRRSQCVCHQGSAPWGLQGSGRGVVVWR